MHGFLLPGIVCVFGNILGMEYVIQGRDDGNPQCSVKDVVVEL